MLVHNAVSIPKFLFSLNLEDFIGTVNVLIPLSIDANILTAVDNVIGCLRYASR